MSPSSKDAAKMLFTYQSYILHTCLSAEACSLLSALAKADALLDGL
jgi:hypothetical protein